MSKMFLILKAPLDALAGYAYTANYREALHYLRRLSSLTKHAASGGMHVKWNGEGGREYPSTQSDQLN